MKKIKFRILGAISFVIILCASTACGAFGEGMLYGLAGGLAGLGGGYGFGTTTTTPFVTAPAPVFTATPQFDFTTPAPVFDGTTIYPGVETYEVPSYSSTSSSSSTSGSTSSSTSKSSSNGKTCLKLSVSDLAHCNGTGVCSRCNGKGRYLDNTFGNNNWVDPCIHCHGSGKCPSCHGTGKRI